MKKIVRLASLVLNVLFLIVACVYWLWPRILAWCHLDDGGDGWTDMIAYGPYTISTRDHANDFMFKRLIKGDNVYLICEDEKYSEFIKRQKRFDSDRHATTCSLLAKNMSLVWYYDKSGKCSYVKLSSNGKVVFCDVGCDGKNNSEILPKRNQASNGVAKATMKVASIFSRPPATAESAVAELDERQTNSSAEAAQYASDMNDVMDEMLNRSEIPADYAETMVALFSDKSRGDVIRDFAVQHIGLYAETLQMRGKYDSDSSESATLRDALWAAAEEMRTIVAAAAFRALADIAAFDPHIDVSRLDSRLAACVTDASASPAARVMAAQLCGERRVVAAKPVLARLAADRAQPEPLRRAAERSARSLAK